MVVSLFASFMEHLEELRARFIKVGIVLIIIFSFILMFRIEYGNLFGINTYYPSPDAFNNSAAQTFDFIKRTELPPDVQLLQIEVGDAVFIHWKIALGLALIIAMPYILYQFWMFVAPALYKKEKKIIAWATIPAAILFIIGFLFGFFYVTPLVLKFLFSYSETVLGTKTLGINAFLDFVFIFSAAFGLIFEMPIIMVGLVKIGIVSSNTWKESWRYAVIGFFIFGAVITPDNSGFTEVIIALPMCLMYLVGYILSRHIEYQNKRAPFRRVTNDE